MKTAILLLADGFEEVEALGTVDFLRRCGVEVTTLSIDNEKVVSARGITVHADALFNKFDLNKVDGLIVPGGRLGAINLTNHDGVIKAVKSFFETGKLVAAICAGPTVLGKAGILGGKNYTMYPGMEKDMKSGNYSLNPVVKDGNIITGFGPAATFAFAEAIATHLGYAKESAQVLKDMLLA